MIEAAATLRDNSKMAAILRKMDFVLKHEVEEGIISGVKTLSGGAPPAD